MVKVEQVVGTLLDHPHEEWSDEELLLSFRDEHDGEAFNALVKRYNRELYSYLRRYLGDAGAAEDVFQETFINVIRNADIFDALKKFRPWLYSIATHQAIDWHRRNKKHTKLSLNRMTQEESDATGLDLLASKEAEGDEHLQLVENAEWIHENVKKLPNDIGKVITYIYFYGMKYREVADLLHIPVGTVKSRAHSGIQKLHEASQAA